MLLRLPMADAGNAAITGRDYAFPPRRELSLGGALLSMVDMDLAVQAPISSLVLHPPASADSIAADVCGGPEGSVAHARAAIGALTKER